MMYRSSGGRESIKVFPLLAKFWFLLLKQSSACRMQDGIKDYSAS